MQSSESSDGTTDALLSFLSQVPMFQAVEAESAVQRRLWRACELCTFIEYRLDGTPDPRGLSDDEIASWSRRGLSDGERLSDPGETQMFRPFWIQIGGDRIGTVAIMTRDTGWSTPNLWISSLYLFPEYRRNSRDKPAVRELVRLLRAQGIRVWFDEDELIPGRSSQALLERGLNDSRTGAVVVGRDGLGPWEDEEMQALLRDAIKRNKPVIPVLLPGAPTLHELPVFLANRTWVDLRRGFEQGGIERLIWGIKGQKSGAPFTSFTQAKVPSSSLERNEKQVS